MPLTSQQWQKALNMEHIREHLIRVGLVGSINMRIEFEIDEPRSRHKERFYREKIMNNIETFDDTHR